MKGVLQNTPFFKLGFSVQLTLHKLKMENVKLKIMVCALRTDLIISGGNTLIFNFQFSIFNSFHRNDNLKFAEFCCILQQALFNGTSAPSMTIRSAFSEIHLAKRGVIWYPVMQIRR